MYMSNWIIKQEMTCILDSTGVADPPTIIESSLILLIPQLWCLLFFFSTRCLRFAAILSATTSGTSVWTWTSPSLWTSRRSAYRKRRLSCREVAYLEVLRLYCVPRTLRLFRYVFKRNILPYPLNICATCRDYLRYSNQGFNLFCKT